MSTRSPKSFFLPIFYFSLPHVRIQTLFTIRGFFDTFVTLPPRPSHLKAKDDGRCCCLQILMSDLVWIHHTRTLSFFRWCVPNTERPKIASQSQLPRGHFLTLQLSAVDGEMGPWRMWSKFIIKYKDGELTGHLSCFYPQLSAVWLRQMGKVNQGSWVESATDSTLEPLSMNCHKCTGKVKFDHMWLLSCQTSLKANGA